MQPWIFSANSLGRKGPAGTNTIAVMKPKTQDRNNSGLTVQNAIVAHRARRGSSGFSLPGFHHELCPQHIWFGKDFYLPNIVALYFQSHCILLEKQQGFNFYFSFAFRCLHIINYRIPQKKDLFYKTILYTHFLKKYQDNIVHEHYCWGLGLRKATSQIEKRAAFCKKIIILPSSFSGSYLKFHSHLQSINKCFFFFLWLPCSLSDAQLQVNNSWLLRGWERSLQRCWVHQRYCQFNDTDNLPLR